MLDAEASGLSTLDVPFGGAPKGLPLAAKEAIRADLEVSYNITDPKILEELISESKNMTELKRNAAMLDPRNDINTYWSQFLNKPIDSLPKSIQSLIQSELANKLGVKGQPHERFVVENYLAASGNQLSVRTISDFSVAKDEFARLDKALKVGDLESIATISPSMLNQATKRKVVAALTRRLGQAGMNWHSARQVIESKDLGEESSSKEPIGQLISTMKHTYGVAWQLEDNKNQTTVKLSQRTLEERCKENDRLDLQSLLARADKETLNSIPSLIGLMHDPIYKRVGPSISDLEVALEIQICKRDKQPPFKALTQVPLQDTFQLPNVCIDTLKEFATDELSQVSGGADISEQLAKVTSHRFATDYESALREYLPGKLFRSEALEILDLPGDAYPGHDQESSQTKVTGYPP